MRPHYATAPRSALGSRQTAEVNEFLWKTYRWMSAGLALTGLVAWFISQSPAAVDLIFGNRILFYGLIIGELAMVFAFTAMIGRVSFKTAAAMFMGYAAVNGLTMAFIFLIYTSSSVAQVFFVTAGAFAGLSIVGATTKKDLTAMGRFMFFGLIGIILASVVNMFFASPAIYWITTYAGILIFAGLTAYHTQKFKQLYLETGDRGNLAIYGALVLYLDFINLFLLLLRVLGSRR